jgi:hypothetical protein
MRLAIVLFAVGVDGLVGAGSFERERNALGASD